MADNEEDTMENSGDEERDLERPPTPDFHHKDDDGFSDISEDEDKEKQYDKQKKTVVATDSPASDTLELNRDDKVVKNNASIDEDSEEERDHESVNNEIDNVDNTETMSNENENDPLGKETVENDSEEQEKLDSPNTSESVRDSDKIALEQENTTSDPEKNIPNDEGEISEISKDDEEGMPVSPLGLELSDPDIAIAEEISKKDVEENFENDTIESEEDENKETKKKESDTQEDFEEKEDKSVIDDEDDDENPSFADDIDVLDDERSEPDEAGGDQLIQDIFGASDEEEEFEGFDQDEIEISRPKPDAPQAPSKSILSDDEDEGVSGEVESMVVPEPKAKAREESDSEDEGAGSSHTVWDFDVMMEQKKASRAKKRRRKGDSELISDSDDLVVDMVKQMKQAAEDDKLLNEAKQAATKKLKLLPLVMTHLNKADLQFTFIDSGILNALKDWLSPLPDGSLPHLQIRTGLLRILSSFPALDTGALKMSGLGKAVMYIYRHPKEIRQNRNVAGKLINEWARPIFGVTSNFKSMSREEREERDYQNMSKRRRLSSAEEGGKTPRSIDRALQGEKKGARPGEKGFIMRARVPTPSNKDYVVRPKSNLEALDFHRVNKVISRADKQMRKFKDRNKSKAPTHAATISIEGRKMAL